VCIAEDAAAVLSSDVLVDALFLSLVLERFEADPADVRPTRPTANMVAPPVLQERDRALWDNSLRHLS
jgi:hypothetical protein